MCIISRRVKGQRGSQRGSRWFCACQRSCRCTAPRRRQHKRRRGGRANNEQRSKTPKLRRASRIPLTQPRRCSNSWTPRSDRCPNVRSCVPTRPELTGRGRVQLEAHGQKHGSVWVRVRFWFSAHPGLTPPSGARKWTNGRVLRNTVENGGDSAFPGCFPGLLCCSLAYDHRRPLTSSSGVVGRAGGKQQAAPPSGR